LVQRQGFIEAVLFVEDVTAVVESLRRGRLQGDVL